MWEGLHLQPDWGFILGVVGIILALAVISYRRRRSLQFYFWENDPVAYHVDDRKLNEAERSVLPAQQHFTGYFKNVGREVIRDREIVKPLRVEFANEVKVASIKVASTNPDNELYYAQEGDRTVIVRFDFIEPQDAVRIDIYYDAEEPSPGRIFGKIEGIEAYYEGFWVDAFRDHMYAMSIYTTYWHWIGIAFVAGLALEWFVLTMSLGIQSTSTELWAWFTDLGWMQYGLLMLLLLVGLIFPLYLARRMRDVFVPFRETMRRIRYWHWKK